MLFKAKVGIAMSARGVAPVLEPELRRGTGRQLPRGDGMGGEGALQWRRLPLFDFSSARARNLGIPTAALPLSLRRVQPVLVLLNVLVVVPAVRYDGPTADHFDLRLRVALQEVGDQFGLRLQGREGLFFSC